MKKKIQHFCKEAEVVLFSMLIAVTISTPLSYIGYVIVRMM